MADSSAVDAAIVSRLAGDATLIALMTDGVYFDVGKKGATKLVIVSQLAHEDAYVFRSSVWERFLYLVKAVSLDTSGGDVKTAAARIHTLLQDASPTVTGYSVMNIQREERVRYTEVDDESDARWQHRGGQYQVLVSPT